MKVLIVATVQSHICQFHRPLVEMLHEHDCIVHCAARNNLAEKNGLALDFADKVYDVPFQRSPLNLSNVKAYRKLKKIIDSGHYDIIHCNTPVGGVIARLAARKVRRQGVKVFYTAHGFHFYIGAAKKNWILYYPIEKIMAHFTDTLITITKEDYYLAKTRFACNVEYIHGVGARTERCFIMSEDHKKEIRAKVGIDDTTKIILNVGELLPNKNQTAVIKAIKVLTNKISDIHLFIAGNGPEKENLQNLIYRLHLENQVTLLGYTLNLPEYLNICDVLVACSYREGLPTNLMEAMLCGKPIVASNNRGHRELVKEGYNGFLVNADDIRTYAARIYKILMEEIDYTEPALECVEPYRDTNVKIELKNIYRV